jgi:DNA invertase Pin-like site-specific DNA recombinase
MKTPRVLALLRVSTDAQDTARQRRDLQRLTERHGLVIVRTLELHGVSGTKTLDNSEVQKLLDDLNDPSIDGLAVSSIDRLLRPKRFQTFGVFDRFVDLKKVIWSQAEGFVDPSADEGFDLCASAASRAGSEWRRLIQRVRDGKEECRLAKGNPDGPATLPRGLLHSKGSGWTYDPAETARIGEIFRLCAEGLSYRAIAARVGGGWTHAGVRSTLRNRLWRDGTRTYSANAVRSTALTRKVIEPLIPAELFDACQRELDGRKESWGRSKRPRRFLAAGLLSCACGKAWYLRATGAKDTTRQKEYYYCSTGFSGRGPKCGARSFQREAVDQAITEAIGTALSSEAVLLPILTEALREKPRQGVRNVEAEISKLEAKRNRIVEMREDGAITREKCKERLSVVDGELYNLRRAGPPERAPSLVDPRRIAAALIRLFARFGKLAFPDQRKLLEEAIRTITIVDGAIPRLTLAGGFLGNLAGAKVEAQLRLPYWPRFPAPGQAPRSTSPRGL